MYSLRSLFLSSEIDSDSGVNEWLDQGVGRRFDGRGGAREQETTEWLD